MPLRVLLALVGHCCCYLVLTKVLTAHPILLLPEGQCCPFLEEDGGYSGISF